MNYPIAAEPVSPVRTRVTESSGATQTLPGGIDLADQGERAYDFAGTASSVLKEVK